MEDVRLAALNQYGLLDTPAEQAFDDIVMLAIRACQTSVALVSLVAGDRQWFKARVGFDACETPLSQSVCAHTMRQPGLLVIPDLRADPRTRDNPLVAAPPWMRFYAGARLHAPDGTGLGALCVMDTAPRPDGLTPEQASSLEALARQVMAQMELRRSVQTRSTALLASHARQHAVFDVTRQLMGVLAPDGTVLEANRAMLHAMGAQLTDVAGRRLWNTPWFAGTPGMSEAIRDAVDEARAGTPVRAEMTLNLPNGVERTYDFTMTPVRDMGGAVVEIMPEATDITELRHAEAALRQSQKMEAVGQLTGGIAHDFNNLLAGVSGSLEMLQTRMRQQRYADVERYLSIAQGAAKRAAALTHRLLAFSRRQTLAPAPTDVNRLVAGMEELIRRTVGPAIELEAIAAGDLWTALVDPSQLENALLNLCINARDAMPDGGRITIETANDHLDANAARQLDMPEGQCLSLRVADTGEGMSADVAARAFEPFFTTKPVGAGAGLGLSMIYGFARQSGGQARIQSRPGEGAAVQIYLPRHIGPANVEAEPRERVAAPPVRKGETALVVDDEPTMRVLAADILDDLGYSVIEAADSLAGLRALQSDMRIDLLVTDIGLPGGMNGRQMAAAARERRPSLKILFITGYAGTSAAGDVPLPQGAVLLTKPFPVEAMAACIQEIMAPPPPLA